MVRVLVSACLLGRACRFDGRDKKTPRLVDALDSARSETVPFCPEEAAGLGTPRPRAWITGGNGDDVVAGRARVETEHGDDVTEAFLAGASEAVARAQEEGCAVAYLKERSPSCGCAQVHGPDGLIEGSGVTAALLRKNGIAIISVE